MSMFISDARHVCLSPPPLAGPSSAPVAGADVLVTRDLLPVAAWAQSVPDPRRVVTARPQHGLPWSLLRPL